MANLGYVSPPDTTEDDAGTDPVRRPLDYAHFPVRMHPTRQFAWWVAWHIDGLRLFPSDSIIPSGESFRLDSHIPAAARRLTLFAGPVLRPAHPPYRGRPGPRRALEGRRLPGSTGSCA